MSGEETDSQPCQLAILTLESEKQRRCSGGRWITWGGEWVNPHPPLNESALLIFLTPCTMKVNAIFCRPNDVVVARDFMTVQLPIGGYTAAQQSTTFFIDRTPGQNTKNTPQSADAKKRHELQQHTKAIAAPSKKNTRPLDRPEQVPIIECVEITPESAIERTRRRQIAGRPRAFISSEIMRTRNTPPTNLRDQNHSYNKASMHLWSFEVKESTSLNGFQANFPHRNNTVQFQTSINKASNSERYVKKPV